MLGLRDPFGDFHRLLAAPALSSRKNRRRGGGPRRTDAGPRSAELERILQRRIDVLKRAAAWEEPWDDDVSPDGILNRPLLALRGVVLSGGGQWAAVAVEGSARTVLVVPGQSLNGVEILTIGQTGMTCRWRGQKFFVPLE